MRKKDLIQKENKKMAAHKILFVCDSFHSTRDCRQMKYVLTSMRFLKE